MVLTSIAPVAAQVNVTTSMYNNQRTSVNNNEATLTPANVNSTNFGKLFSQSVDGYVFAQPLYVAGVTMGAGTFQAGTIHNVVFVATEHDTVYAFDADSNTGANAQPLWRTSFLSSGVTTVSSSNVNSTDINPEYGITGTPVIDLSTNTLYVVAETLENSGSNYMKKLHALDITTGAEKPGSPAVISASVTVPGQNPVPFVAQWQLNRPGLLLYNGVVYIGFGSHGDSFNWEGWILGYSYNGSSFSQVFLFCTAPSSAAGGGNGIWMSAQGLPMDAGSNLFAASGNGPFDTVNTPPVSYGDSILRFDLSKGPAVQDYFTPSDQSTLALSDGDVGSGGIAILPDLSGPHPHLLVQAGKDGLIHVVDRDSMGHYNSSGDTNIVQEINAFGSVYSSPVYFNGKVYFWAEADVVKAFTVTNSAQPLSTTPTDAGIDRFNFPGATPAISANGTSNAILWALESDAFSDTGPGGPAVLFAYDASHLSAGALYSSKQNSSRDNPGGAIKFAVPTVANGKVYVGAAGQLSVFGELGNTAPSITSASSTTFTVGTAGSFTVTTTGSPTPTLTETGALPSGVTFLDNGNGTATMSGTPASGSGGTYSLTIIASNGVGTPANQGFTLTVSTAQTAPAITSAASTTFTVGTAGSFTVTATGSPTPTLAETGALPSGVTFVNNGNGTATLSGTPAAGSSGTYVLTLTASNGVGSPASQSFTLKVNQAPAITSANTTTFTVGTAGSFTVTTTGSPTPTLTETGALPSGVTFVNNGNGTATLSGTPAAGSGGTYIFTITASNGVGTAASQSFTLTVSGGGGGGGSSNFAYVTGSVSGVYNASGTTSTTLSVPLHQTPGAGHLLVCAATWQSSTAAATMSDPNNGIWAAVGAAKTGVGSLSGYRGQMFYIPSAASASTTVTMTISSAVAFRAFECAEYSYTGTIATLDGTPQYSATPATGGVAAVSGVTTTNSSDLVFADCLGVDTTCAAGGGYTGLNDANAFDGGIGSFGANFWGLTGQMIEYKAGVAAGAQSATFGTGTATDNVILGLLALTAPATQAAPVITSANNTAFAVGTAGSFTVTTTGAPTPTLTETGALPSGVTFVNNGNGTATLSGTPAAGTAGSYLMTLTASNGVGSPASQSFTLTVNQAPAITSANNTTFTVGTAGSFTVTTTGSPTPTLTETGALPGGVTFVNNGNGTATLSGTPAAGSGGTYNLTVTASNGAGTPANQNFILTVNQAPAITSANIATFTVGTAGSFAVTTTGTPAPTLTETGALPGGVTFVNNGNGTATLSGTPAAGSGGTYGLALTASNGVGSPASQSFTLTVNTAQIAPAITSANNTTFTVGSTSGSFTVTTTGAPTPTLTETGTLPSGVTFKDNGNGTATLSGIPAAGSGGTYVLTLTASNGVGSPASQSFTLTVNQAPAITSGNTTTFTVGSTSGSFTVTTTGTPTSTLTETGALPSGVAFKDTGNGTATLSGIPAAGSGGTYVLTLTASNGVGSPASQSFTLKVNQAPAITSGNTTTFTVGTAGSFTMSTTGSPAPTLTETGALPSGVTFVNNGNGTATLSGTPAAGSGGTYLLTLTASNGVGTAANQSFTLTVNGGGGGGGSSNFAYVAGSVSGVYIANGATGTTVSVALHQLPGAGHLLTCAATWQSSTATAAMSDPNNGTWAAVGAAKTGVGSLSGFRGQMFYVPSAVSASTTVTLTISSAVAFRAFECAEYSYTGTLATLDGTAQYSTTPATGGVATVSGVTTTNSSDLVFADCLGVDTTCAAGGGYTGLNDANAFDGGIGSFGANFWGLTGQMIEYKAGVAAGAQSATFGTGTATDNVILGLVAF